MQIIREWDLKEDEIKKFDKSEYCNNSLEIGCGNGLFLSEMSLKSQDMRFFGLEIKYKCIERAKKKIERNLNSNVTLINGDAFTAVNKFFYDEFFDNIYINFPDPWFKKRHLKKRVINPNNVKIYHSKLKNDGILYFVTDNEDYRDYGIETIMQSGLFEPMFELPYYKQECEDYQTSLYETKWRDAGRCIYYVFFKKK